MEKGNALVEAEFIIDGFTNRGEGVGRLNGLAVFVPGALPGEKVRVKNIQGKKNYAKAQLSAVLQPSAHRVMADCPLFGRCGGCALQHADSKEQLRLKKYLVEASVRRIGGLDTPVRDVIASPLAMGYRSRMTYHALQIRGRTELGFYMNNSKVFIPASVCMLPREPIRRAAKALPALLGTACPGLRHVVLRCNNEGRLLMTLVGDPIEKGEELAQRIMAELPELSSVWQCSGAPVWGIYGQNWWLLAGEPRFRDNIAGVEMELSPASFTQVNPEQTELLYSLAAEAAQLNSSSKVLDLYCGAGAISLYMASRAGEIVGVESYAPAVDDAKRNAEINGVENCLFIAGKTEEILPRLAGSVEAVDAAVLDPPRAGCDKAALEALAKMAPERIVYISCDPATLSRDMRLLTQNGYTAEYVQPVDMFPQTPHVEAVCLLSKLNAKQHIEINLNMDELDLTDAEQKAT